MLKFIPKPSCGSGALGWDLVRRFPMSAGSVCTSRGQICTTSSLRGGIQHETIRVLHCRHLNLQYMTRSKFQATARLPRDGLGKNFHFMLKCSFISGPLFAEFPISSSRNAQMLTCPKPIHFQNQLQERQHWFVLDADNASRAIPFLYGRCTARGKETISEACPLRCQCSRLDVRTCPRTTNSGSLHPLMKDLDHSLISPES